MKTITIDFNNVDKPAIPIFKFKIFRKIKKVLRIAERPPDYLCHKISIQLKHGPKYNEVNFSKIIGLSIPDMPQIEVFAEITEIRIVNRELEVWHSRFPQIISISSQYNINDV